MESYISNAGLVILNPFLDRLFDMLSLTQNGEFKNTDARVRAALLLQYAVFGSTKFSAHGLELNKLLMGLDAATPIPLSVDLTPQEIEIVNGLLVAVLHNWSKLSNTSTEGLRESFLQRDGRIEEKDDSYLLTVQRRSFDVLLDTLPWSFRIIKFSWMEKALHVEWI